MSMLFAECKSLEILPDISKWKMNNVETMTSMFSDCLFFLIFQSGILLILGPCLACLKVA